MSENQPVTLSLNTQEGKEEELALDLDIEVGVERYGSLFPSLDQAGVPGVVWKCVSKTATSLEFEGEFCGQHLMAVVIERKAKSLILRRKGVQS